MKTEIIPEMFKVYFFAQDQPIQVNIYGLGTVADLKAFLEDATCIKPDNQKIVINSKVLKQPDSYLLKKLDLKPQDKIILLTQKSQELSQFKKDKKEEQIANRKKKHMVLYNLAQFQKRPRDIQAAKSNFNKLMKTMVTKQHLQIIANKLFGNQVWRSKQKMLLRKGALKCMIDNLVNHEDQSAQERNSQHKDRMQGAVHLWSLLEGPACKAILSYPLNVRQPDAEPIDTIDKTILKQLKDMGYYESKISDALERTCNNYYETLLLLSINKDNREFPSQYENQQSQQTFLYRWIERPDNQPLRYRLSLQDREYDLYLNSLKHRCPPFYRVLKQLSRQ